MNNQYKNALDRRIEIFKKDFISFSRKQYSDEQGKLIHPGEFGRSRELITKDLIEVIIPKSRPIETRGFIISPNNGITTEQDLILYSEQDTPILTLEDNKFFPIETVIGVGQVKSIIQSKKDLKGALDDLLNVKVLRHTMGNQSIIWKCQESQKRSNIDKYVETNPFDQVFTFLICEKFNFDITPIEIDDLYEKSISPILKHNMILDLSKGIYGYRMGKGDGFVGVPFVNNEITKTSFIPANSKELHIHQFLTNLSVFSSSNTIFHPDMALYYQESENVLNSF